jgi:hypothetical protein
LAHSVKGSASATRAGAGREGDNRTTPQGSNQQTCIGHAGIGVRAATPRALLETGSSQW